MVISVVNIPNFLADGLHGLSRYVPGINHIVPHSSIPRISFLILNDERSWPYPQLGIGVLYLKNLFMSLGLKSILPDKVNLF
jgi:hypothetical protein